MGYYCNRWWVLYDTAITLYLECVFQACIQTMVLNEGDPDCAQKQLLQAKYAEFLNLPLYIERYHPLTFAIAQRFHGHQMRTGWSANPKSMTDRNAKENSILVETQTSNYLKSNYHEVHYPDLKAMILEVGKLPLAIANPGLQMSPYDAKLDRLRRRIPVMDDSDSEDDEVYGPRVYSNDDDSDDDFNG